MAQAMAGDPRSLGCTQLGLKGGGREKRYKASERAEFGDSLEVQVAVLCPH